MSSRRRTVLALTAVLTAVPLTAGCGAVEKAFGCAETAIVVTEGVEDLQQALAGAGENPVGAKKALDEINSNLRELNDQDAEIDKAVDDLAKSVRDVRDDLDAGREPDLAPITKAADELTAVCSP